MGLDTTPKIRNGARIQVLTAVKIKQNLKPGMYADGLGLYLKGRVSNSKSWIFRYRTGGRLRDMGLGSFHTFSLAEAREKAEVCRVMRLKGLDPLEERHKSNRPKQSKRLRPPPFRSVPRRTSPPTRRATVHNADGPCSRRRRNAVAFNKRQCLGTGRRPSPSQQWLRPRNPQKHCAVRAPVWHRAPAWPPLAQCR